MTITHSFVGWRRVASMALLSVCATGLFAMAQQPAAESAAPTAAKKPAVAKGRLPAYFPEVVSGEQRTEIYSIQAKYAAEIRKLEEALLAVVKQRNAEIEQVLSPEQAKKVAQLREEARERNAARAAARLQAAKAEKAAAAAAKVEQDK